MSEDIHWQKYASRFRTFPAQLPAGKSGVGMVVCIPVYAEPGLLETLGSLHSCALPGVPVEVILLFNKSNRMTEDEVLQHELTWQQTLTWIDHHRRDGLSFLQVYLELCPDPKGGVGWARKLVLDEAARRIGQDGILLCLDADCIIEQNYLQVIWDYFQVNTSCDAASIYFEHQLDILSPTEKDAIAQYELHLRYLVQAMRWAGHPFAFHTVGSSMAVRRKAYLLHGGMNTRQAGEDFYFLQKFIEIDALHEIRQTTVYPSARISGRVPFGTGRAMHRLMSVQGEWMTTDPDIFRFIKPLFASTDRIRQFCVSVSTGNEDILYSSIDLDPRAIQFLNHIGFTEQCRLIAAQTTTPTSFRRRFFRYFNSFMMIRYMHYISQHYLPEVPIFGAAWRLASELKLPFSEPEDVIDLLVLFRQMEKQRLAT